MVGPYIWKTGGGLLIIDMDLPLTAASPIDSRENARSRWNKKRTMFGRPQPYVEHN